MSKILVIEDDVNTADFISRGLRQKEFDVTVASTGEEGLKSVDVIHPDVVILDLMLPDGDGIDICRELRANSDVGIIILTARHLVGDRVLGLEAGADDYLPKPFAFEEPVKKLQLKA